MTNSITTWAIVTKDWSRYRKDQLLLKICNKITRRWSGSMMGRRCTKGDQAIVLAKFSQHRVISCWLLPQRWWARRERVKKLTAWDRRRPGLTLEAMKKINNQLKYQEGEAWILDFHIKTIRHSKLNQTNCSIMVLKKF